MPSLCLCPPPHRAQIWESRSDKLTSKQKAGQQGSPSDSFYPRGDGGPLQPSGDCGVSHCKRTWSGGRREEDNAGCTIYGLSLEIPGAPVFPRRHAEPGTQMHTANLLSGISEEAGAP
ncbi:uncharacterized protein LOC144006415 isoform X7 [Festucalex cinctus]